MVNINCDFLIFFLYGKQRGKKFLFPFLYLYLKAEIVVSRVKAHTLFDFSKKIYFILYSFHVCQKICHRHLPYHTFTHFTSTLTLSLHNSTKV